ncbi:hypothetical protein [Bradyrhizobium canariense]|nr:hypothetical protein [Bradyrhizobium canariense]
MSKAEARQQFGSYIYWHGPDHCWDGTPSRGNHQVAHGVRRKIDQPRWRDAMSAMASSNDAPTRSPEEESVRAPPADRRAEAEPSVIDARWVDISQVAPPLLSEPNPVPRGAVVVLVFIVSVLMLAVIEILFRVALGAFGKEDCAAA